MVKKAKGVKKEKNQEPAVPPKEDSVAPPEETETARESAAPAAVATPPRPVVTGPNLEWIFSYHAPSEDQVDKYDRISEAAKGLARVILESCPACADRSAAIRKVREARMTANASIALHGAV